MDPETHSSFGALLKAFRRARDFSQEALAERSGLSRETISLLERGLRLSPQRDTVGLLAKTLKLSSDEQTQLLAAMLERRWRPVTATRAEINPPSSLPLRLTSFVGREREVAEVRELLLSKRLLTLSGPGGIGKSSLALAVAEVVQGQFADGVSLVELASLTSGELVPTAVAVILGVREQPGERVLITVSRVMGTAHRLLVLDNCEHLIDACAATVEALLQWCPRLQFLVTSREPLRVGAEVIWRVPSLTLPADGDHPPQVPARSEAVRLFVERAAAVRPGFGLHEGNAAAVTEICRRLDGIPLAIELAAARVAVLSPIQIAQHLDDRFRLLTTGSRTALARHQTLRTSIDWSYALLSEPEQFLFRRLSVFAGGWSLEAAEEVCGEGDGNVVSGVSPHRRSPESRSPTPDTIELMAQLQSKSLVLLEEQKGVVRFRLLETLRQYGWDRLTEAGEVGVTRDRHGDWFLQLAEQAKPQLAGPHQVEWLDRLEGERDNLRAALAWAMDRGPAEAGLRLAGALWRFWQVRNYRREGREWLSRALAVPDAQLPTLFRAQALDGACELCELDLYQGDRAVAQCLAEESLAIYRALDDRPGIARSLGHLAMAANQAGDKAMTEELGAAALTHAREAGDRWVVAQALETLGLAAVQCGDRPLARRRLGECLAIFRALGDDRAMVVVLDYLGWVDMLQGDNRAARACFEEAMAIARPLRIDDRIGGLLRWLGLLARDEGNFEQAWRLLEESDAVARRVGDRGLSALTHYSMGLLARAQGDRGRARACAQASLSMARDIGATLLQISGIGLVGILAIAGGAHQQGVRLLARSGPGPTGGWWHLPHELQDHQESVLAARIALGERAFTQAWADGRAMSLEEAVAHALEAAGD